MLSFWVEYGFNFRGHIAMPCMNLASRASYNDPMITGLNCSE